MMSVVAGGELIKVDCGSGALGLTLVTDYVIIQGTPITPESCEAQIRYIGSEFLWRLRALHRTRCVCGPHVAHTRF